MSSPASKTPAVAPCQTMRGHTERVRGVVHLPGGRRVITCSWDGSLRVWGLEDGAQIGDDWRDVGDEVGVLTIALSPNSSTVASGNSDMTVKLWDVETGKVIAKWKGHTDGVYSVCWSADGERVVSGSWEGTARVWDVKSGKTVLGPIKTEHESVWAVMYSPDSTKFATGGYKENAVKIWDAKTGKLLTTLKHNGIVCSLAWTSDGNKLISASFGLIRTFDTATWQQIAILEGHTGFVEALSLSENDRLLASAADDKTARLWNLDTNLPVRPPLQHKDRVECAALSADGKVLVTGGNDKNAYAWNTHAILKKAGLEDLLLPIPHVAAGKSLMNRNATRRPPIHARRITPGFFDGVQNGAQSSAARGTSNLSSTHGYRRSARAPSSMNLHVLRGRFSSLFRHTESNTDGATELQQRPKRTIFSRGPRIVEVAAVRDKEALFVAPPPAQQTQQQNQSHGQGSSTTPPPPGTNTTTPGARPTHSLPLRLLAHLVLFLCCASPQHADGNAQSTQQQQQSQSQGPVQSQASSSPATASTSATPPAPVISTILPNAANVQSRPLPLRTRFVLFLCCASPPHADGH